MEWLLTANNGNARLLRTIIQGVLGCIPGIINSYLPYMPGWVAVVCVPVIMCILAPVMAMLGDAIAKDEKTVAMTD